MYFRGFKKEKTMRIVTYNVNGIRSAMNKGLMDWLQNVNPDVVCIQEIKAHPEQLNLEIFETAGYHAFWHPAVKKGYSGVALLTKQVPDHIEYGCGMDVYDQEGRLIRADFGKLSVMSVYMPSGTTGEIRQAFKMQWLSDFKNYIDKLKSKRPELIISGDYNICHKAIDIHDPVRNAKSSGFLPEERAWVDEFVNSGFTDAFRHFNSEPHQYTWWSQRANSRAKNLGWRIDYHQVSKTIENRLKRAAILPEARHSDHCPVLLEIE